MTHHIRKFLLCAKVGLLLLGHSAFAQGVITIDPNTQRYVGTESSFNRGKYLTFHTWFKSEDADFEKFKKEYNIDPSYNGSRMFNNPANRHKKGVYPKVEKQYTGVRDVSDFVSTTSPKAIFWNRKVDYSTVDTRPFTKEAAKFAAEYFSYQSDLVPKYYEPFNEPMVHAGDFLAGAKGENRKQKVEAIIGKMIDYHQDVIEAIHAKPELQHMMVGGFGSAFPEFEANNFGLWNARFKRFIDQVGEDIDFLALHLYDGSGVNNKKGRRSGSNSEAILDMLEAYSYIKLGEVKPYAITEYGRLVPDQPDYKNLPMGNYVPLVNAQAVRSQMHLVMNFIERGDNLLLSVPFTVGKSKPKARYAKSSLWVTQEDGTVELSQRKYFFEVWKDVKGDRVSIQSSDINVQTQAFVDGNKLFVVLNNLDKNTTVDLNLLNKKRLQNGEIKRLMIYEDKLPDLSIEKFKQAPSTLDIRYGETVVLTYNFKSAIPFNHVVRNQKYYADTYLQPIKSNAAVRFSINHVKITNGAATLRLGIGRDHGLSLRPTLKINGHPVEFKGDVIRGSEQEMRRRFFGVLEIPVKPEYLKSGNNTLEVSFPDEGGHITSAILQM